MKYIPMEKRSKKVQRELHQAQRGTWGAINPVTRKPPNPKAYNRKKARREGMTFYAGPSGVLRQIVFAYSAKSGSRSFETEL